MVEVEHSDRSTNTICLKIQFSTTFKKFLTLAAFGPSSILLGYARDSRLAISKQGVVRALSRAESEVKLRKALRNKVFRVRDKRSPPCREHRDCP